MADCIYCGAVATGEEHWLSRGFGEFRGAKQLQDRLCGECNGALGQELDEEILRTGPTSVLRSVLGIEGRHGPPPNPFHYRVMQGEPPNVMTMPCGHGDYTILGEMYAHENGDVRARPLRQLVFRKPDGQVVPVHFPPGYNGALLKRLLNERGLDTLQPFEMFLDEGEQHDNPQLRSVLHEALGSFSVVAYGGEGTAERSHQLLQTGISLRYIRAIAKIGFHYFLATTTIVTGAELFFQPIRQFVRYGEGDWENFVTLVAPQFIGELAQGYGPEHFSHYFRAGKRNEMYSLVQLFIGPQHVLPPSVIRLGITRRPIHDRCHWLGYYSEKVGRFDGEIRELPVGPR
jgi:hypothetical protein